jgi:alkylated DNA repair dioxygenase AlkB
MKLINTKYKDLNLKIFNINKITAEKWFNYCMDKINWESSEIFLFGKLQKIPRLQSWYAKENIEYSYSGKKLTNNIWTKELLLIKKEIEKLTNTRFNSMLANLYRDGNDSMGLHSDDEKELGDKPIIASVSLGADRPIYFYHKKNNDKYKIMQKNGDVLLMYGLTQENWKHCINKSKKVNLPRINLTFRSIIT